MFPFVAPQAIALKQAKQKSVKAAQRSADTDPPVQTVRRGLLRSVLDAFVEIPPTQGRLGDRSPSAPKSASMGTNEEADRVS